MSDGQIEIQETLNVRTVFKWSLRMPKDFFKKFREGRRLRHKRWKWVIRVSNDDQTFSVVGKETESFAQAKRNARLYMRTHANEVFGQSA